MSFIPVSKIEAIVADAYNEFYRNNQELYHTNTQEYWFLASRFKDEKVRDIIYTVSPKIVKDYDPSEDFYKESDQLIDTVDTVRKKSGSKHRFFILF